MFTKFGLSNISDCVSWSADFLPEELEASVYVDHFLFDGVKVMQTLGTLCMVSKCFK